MSALFDQNYQPWNGTFQPHPFRTLAIATATLSNVFRRHVLALSLLGGLAILFSLPSAFVGMMLPGFDPALAAASCLSNAILWTSLFVLPVAGSGLVASDLKHNALLMYFSKSIVRADYIAGKMAAATVLAFLPAALAPILSIGISLYGLGDKADTVYACKLTLAVLASIPVAVVPAISLIMAFSSCTKRTFLAGIGFVAVMMILRVVSVIISEGAKAKWGYLLALDSHVLKVAMALMPGLPPGVPASPMMRGTDLDVQFPYSAWLSAGILAGVTALSLAVVVWRTADAEKRS